MWSRTWQWYLFWRDLEETEINPWHFVRMEIKKGAMASSAAPDDNNLVVMGVSAEDMSIAANYLIEQGGGQVVVADGEILEFLPLPVGGIVSDEEPEVIAAQEKKIDQAARMLGSDLPDPMMYMFFLPITAIPDYAITDVGPVDYLALTTFDPVFGSKRKINPRRTLV